MTDSRTETLIAFEGLCWRASAKAALVEELNLQFPRGDARTIAAEVNRLWVGGAYGATGFRAATELATVSAFAWRPGTSAGSMRLWVQRPSYYTAPRAYSVELRLSTAGKPYVYAVSAGRWHATEREDDTEELVLAGGLLMSTTPVEEAMRANTCSIHYNAAESMRQWDAIGRGWQAGELGAQGAGTFGDRRFEWRPGSESDGPSLIVTSQSRWQTYSLEWRVSPDWGPYVRRFWLGEATDILGGKEQS